MCIFASYWREMIFFDDVLYKFSFFCSSWPIAGSHWQGDGKGDTAQLEDAFKRLLKEYHPQPLG
jgi:hypothetical protein